MFPSAQMPSSWLALDLLTSLRSSRCASLRSLGSSMRPFYSTVHNIKGAGPLLSTATSISGLAAELVSVSAPATRGYCGREMPWLEVKSRPPVVINFHCLLVVVLLSTVLWSSPSPSSSPSPWSSPLPLSSYSPAFLNTFIRNIKSVGPGLGLPPLHLRHIVLKVIPRQHQSDCQRFSTSVV